ncbi:MAG TPA: TetR/AcrR family transcriptional regulator [Solirubrobacterales bacterium]|nr:TetR/AcrR family transcriptional regulator [Solirubrobacterales bacterium]
MVATPWGDSEELREKMLAPGPSNAPEAVVENQRGRLFGAMVASVAERGYANTRVADLVEISGVSLRSFYDLFPDKQACLVGALEALVRSTIGPVLESSGPEEWELDSKRRLGVAATLAATQPAAAKMCLVEAYVAGPAVAAVVDEATVRMEGLVRDRLAGSERWADLPAEIGTFAIGAIFETFRGQLIDHHESRLPAVAEHLANLLLRFEAPVRPLRSAARPPEIRPEQLEASDHAERALRAFEALLARQTFAETTMEQVAKGAGMSVRTLYANFAGRDELMLGAIDSAGAQVVAAALPAYRRQPSPPEGMRAAFAAILGLLASRPNLAHMLLLASYEGGAPALRRRAEALRPLETLLMRSAPNALPVPRTLLAQSLLGGVLWLARRQLSEGGPGALAGMAPICTFIALAPTLGADRATAAAEGKSYRRQPPGQGGGLEHSVAGSTNTPLLAALGREPHDVEGLVEEVALPREELESQLAKLEDAALIERMPGADGPLFRSRWPLWRTEEWERLGQAERETASAEILWAIGEDTEKAVAAGTFDAHPERTLVRLPLWVDEEGWRELHDALALTLEECFAIQQRIRERVDAKEGPSEGFAAGVHLVSFETAPPEQSTEF